ncbi:MAG TPA: NAD-dependent epimerase/dehydratase family protein [Candidatus Limnocylindrales bacterium]|nr:NAD-dependent epimerase/dehydratase family protein [Candidatus Limnocylindrales bacterium]
MAQRILVLGGDGYLGWPTAMAFSRAGHRVAVIDNFAKRQWELELGVRPLFPVPTLHERVRAWREVTENEIELHVGDLTDYAFVESVIDGFRPDTIVHYGEQPSAPYSMIDVRHATYTQANNVVGNLNVLFAIRDRAPETHLVKLGTMGEYGTPDIDIEEGYLTVNHNGREHTFLYPKTPGSMYHLSKVHDSHNIHFATRIWGLRATDLNQGVVYGVETDESALDPRLATSFHYDEVFGTALNRFCVQAVIGHPLSVYGKGGQTRGYLNIRDTIQCVALATANPAAPGELRVYNQFTEQFSVLELAERVKAAAGELGWDVSIEHAPNPRKELESHYYNARHSKLLDLGLQPRLLSEELIDTMLAKIRDHRGQIDPTTLVQNVRWVPEAMAAAAAGGAASTAAARRR